MINRILTDEQIIRLKYLIERHNNIILTCHLSPDGGCRIWRSGSRGEVLYQEDSRRVARHYGDVRGGVRVGDNPRHGCLAVLNGEAHAKR